MILRKGVFRTIRSSKLQYGGAITLIMLASMLFVMLSSSLDAVEKSNLEFEEEYNQESFHFYTSEPLSSEQIVQFETTYPIEIERRQAADVTYESEKVIRAFTLTEKVNLPYVSEGKLPETELDIAIGESFATENNLVVGDTIDLNGNTFTIVGTILLPDYVYAVKNETDLINNPKAFGISLVTKGGMENLTSVSIEYYVCLADDSFRVKELKEDILKETPIIKWLDEKDNPRVSYIDTEIEGTKSFSMILPLFIMVIAMMMVILLVNRRLEAQRKQIGTLLALGYTKGEILTTYLQIPLLIGAVGGLLGAIIGLLTSIPLTELYTYYYNIPILVKVYWNIPLLIGVIIVPVGLLLLTGYFTIRRQVNRSPLELMKPPVVTVRIPKRLSFLSFDRFKKFSTRFRLRMLARNSSRVLYLMIGIIFSTMLLMYGFITISSMDTLMTTTYEKVMKYDYAVYYKTLKTEDVSEEVDEFSLVEGKILHVNKNGKTEEVEDKKFIMYGIDSNITMLNLYDEAEEPLTEELKNGIIINKVLAYGLDVKKGDQLTVKNEINDKVETFTITGVSEMYTGTFGYYDRQNLNAFAGYPQDSYMGVWTKEKPQDDENILMVENKQEVIETFESITGPMNYSVGIMSLLAFVIGVIIITLLTNVMVEENENAISLLKVIGYDDQKITKLMLNIYTPVVVIAYFIGIPTALFSLDSMMKSVANQTNYALPILVEPYMIFAGLVIMLGTYYFSIYISKRKLQRVSLQEVLKKQES